MAAHPAVMPVRSRRSDQREAIRQAFVTLDRPLSPQEVLVEARQQHPALGQATVYRALKTLLAEGWLAVVDLPGEWARYEMAGHGHHHHFACTTCRKVFDLPGCAGHLPHALPPGFAAESHVVVIYGRCHACAPKSPPSKTQPPRAERSKQ